MCWFLAMLFGNVVWAKFIHDLGFDLSTWNGATLLLVPAWLWGWFVRDIQMIVQRARP